MRTTTQLKRALGALRMASLALAVMALTGCAVKGQYAVAAYGAQASEIAVKAQAVMVEADKSGTNPNKDVTARAMKAFDDLGGYLSKFANALTVFDALSPAEQEAQVPKLEEMISEARRLVRVVLVFVPGEAPLGEQLLKLFDNLDAAFTQIQNGLRPRTT